MNSSNRRLFWRRGAICLLVGAAVFGSAPIAFAQNPGDPQPGFPGFFLTFDELGNGTLGTPSGIGPDPGVAVAGVGVQYALPVPVIPGDVLVKGPADDVANFGYSDRLVFDNGPVGGILTFQSLRDDASPPDPADVPTFPITSSFVVFEIGPEGNNSFSWTPGAGFPTGATYQGISDTPEPSTLILGALGLVALYALAWRRRIAR
jgi:hypothetical protein